MIAAPADRIVPVSAPKPPQAITPAPQMLAGKLAARYCPGRRRISLLLTVTILFRKLPVLRLLSDPKSIHLPQQIPQIPSSSDPHPQSEAKGRSLRFT
jgi:hypothetical protein